MRKIGRALAVCVTASILAASAAVSASAASFRDVSGHWAEATINQWVDRGYINGYPDGTFRPKEPITRTEFAVVANHAFNFWNTTAIYFPDVSQNFWGYAEIQKAFAAGYMSGDAGGTFRPKGYVTRQEAAVMLANIKGLGFSGSAPYYADSAQISSWARNSVNAVSAAGYMSGYPDGSFRPKAQISRAEVVTMLNKALTGSSNTNTYVPPVQQPTTTTTDSVRNMTLRDTTLRNTVVSGDLTIPSSMSGKNITLDNVTVRGTLIVEGGGTITAEECSINELRMNKSSATFRSEDGTTVAKTTFRSNGTLEGEGYRDVSIANSNVNTVTIDAEVDSLTLDTDADVRLYSGADIDTFEATKSADDALIEISKGARVRNMNIRDSVRIAGSGKIDNMTAYVSGIRSEIEPESLSRKNGASSPDFDYEYSGTRHEGSSSSSSSSANNKTISKDFDGNGAKYKNVTITDDADVEDMRVTNNLTVSADVGNGTVRLEDIEVNGNVYVYGGGSGSVIFINCDIDGDVISNKNSSASRSQTVALRFDSRTKVGGEIRIWNHTILEDYSGSPELDHVVVETRGAEVEIGIDIDTLEMDARTNLDVKSGVTIGTLKTNRGIGTTTVDMRGSARIRNIDARSDVIINGTGTVNTVKKDSGVDVSFGSNITHNPGGSTTGTSVTGVSISPATAKVEVGKTLRLTATVEPSTATDKTVTWTSGNTAIATVDGNGVVKGVKTGKATITVTTTDGGKTATREVEVVAAGTIIDPDTPVTQMTIDPAVVTLQEGATQTLRLKFPDGETYTEIRWAISEGSGNIELTEDASNNTRLLTAKQEGEATITVTARNSRDQEVTATRKVTVTKKSSSGTVALTKVDIGFTADGYPIEYWEIKPGSKANQLAAVLSPSDAVYKKIEWRSDNTGTAAPNITDSKILKSTYLEAGSEEGSETTITLTVWDMNDKQYTATCKIKVTKDATSNTRVEKVTIDSTMLELNIGEKRTLTATVTPADAVSTKVKWRSNRPDIAAVDEDTGEVTAVSTGTAVIYAESVADKTKSATCNVTVKAASATGITLKYGGQAIQDGGKIEVIAGEPAEKLKKLEATAASGGTVVWNSSDNGTIASVAQDGTVTGVHVGTATITATAGNETASVQVKVNPGVTVTKNPGDGVQGGTVTFNYVIEGCEDVATEDITITPRVKKQQSTGSAWTYYGENESWIITQQDETETITVSISPEAQASSAAHPYYLELGVQVTGGYGTTGLRSFDVSAADAPNVVVTGVQIFQVNEDSSETLIGDTVEWRVYTPIKLKAKLLSEGEEDADQTQTVTWQVDTNRQYSTWEEGREAGPANEPVVFELQPGKTVMENSVETELVVTAPNGKFVRCTIKGIVVPVTGVTLNKSTLTLKVCESEKLTATVDPENATNKAVTWSSSNEDVATVNENGLVTAVAPGTATITATAGGQSATCTVTVPGITLDKTPLLLAPGGTETLTATVFPDNAADKTVRWESNNTSVATVEDGKVTVQTGATVGQAATITATVGSFQPAECIVTVKAADTSGGNNGGGNTGPGDENDNPNGNEETGNNTPAQGASLTSIPVVQKAPVVQETPVATQAAQQTSAPRTFSFIPQRALQGAPSTPSVTVEPEQKAEPVQEAESVQKTETVKEPEKVQEPAQQEPVQETIREPEQKNVIALTCADSFKAGETLTLSGTVNGSTSALRKIEWSIQNDGGTGAKIRDGALSAETAGTVRLAATVQNSGTTEYFTITVLPGDKPAAAEPNMPEQTEPGVTPEAPGQPTETPAEGEPTVTPEGQAPAEPQVVTVTLPDGRVVTNVKKLQRNVGAGIALNSIEALPEGMAANSVEWKIVSVGNTGVSIKDNFLVNVNSTGVVLLSRTVHTTDVNGNVSSAVMYYEITIVPNQTVPNQAVQNQTVSNQ